MPIYEYQCQKCRKVTEAMQKFSDFTPLDPMPFLPRGVEKDDFSQQLPPEGQRLVCDRL